MFKTRGGVKGFSNNVKTKTADLVEEGTPYQIVKDFLEFRCVHNRGLGLEYLSEATLFSFESLPFVFSV